MTDDADRMREIRDGMTKKAERLLALTLAANANGNVPAAAAQPRPGDGDAGARTGQPHSDTSAAGALRVKIAAAESAGNHEAASKAKTLLLAELDAQLRMNGGN